MGGSEGGGAAEAAVTTVDGGLLRCWKIGGEIEALLKNTPERWTAIAAEWLNYNHFVWCDREENGLFNHRCFFRVWESSIVSYPFQKANNFLGRF